MKRAVSVSMLLITTWLYCKEPLSPQTDADRISIKVMTIAMFENGQVTGDAPGEAQLWVERERLTHQLQIPGLDYPLFYNDDGHGLIVTDVGPANAAASLMAIGLDRRLDLHSTYFLVAGVAGTSPEVATLGSAAWAEWVVNADMNFEIDIRELPSTWSYGHFRMGCEAPWCEGWDTGNEVWHLNRDLTEWAFRLSRNVELKDNEVASRYRSKYPANLPARKAPFVLKSDTVAGGTFWHGKISSEWAEWWVKKWTGGAGTYGMTSMEDCGTLTALMRLGKAGLIDVKRIMVLRAASNFDQPQPGQSVIESPMAATGGIPIAIENVYRVGSAVTRHIISHWSAWRGGIPALE